MANEKRLDLIDRNALLEEQRIMYHYSRIENAPTVHDYTAEQVASIIQQADKAEARNQELEKECAWLKSCLNCKIRKECPRHCGKVVHGCDHWEYGDSTVDAVEVVHGRWKPYHEADIGYDEYGVRCSNCGFEVEDHEVRFIMHYCPNCGAKIDGDGNEHNASN